MDKNKAPTYCLLLATLLAVSSCTQREVPDDFTKLRAFEADLAQLGRANSKPHAFTSLGIKLARGRVVSITITGRGINKLPASIYGFQQLTELIV
jgi:hypothetical protein